MGYSRLHPLLQIWYQPEKFADIPRERLPMIDGNMLLGLRLLWCGHRGTLRETTRWWSTQTRRRKWLAAECYAPMESGITDLRRYAKRTGLDSVKR